MCTACCLHVCTDPRPAPRAQGRGSLLPSPLILLAVVGWLAFEIFSRHLRRFSRASSSEASMQTARSSIVSASRRRPASNSAQPKSFAKACFVGSSSKARSDALTASSCSPWWPAQQPRPWWKTADPGNRQIASRYSARPSSQAPSRMRKSLQTVRSCGC